MTLLRIVGLLKHPYVVCNYVSGVLNNKIFIISESLTQIYDPETDNWSFGAAPPFPVDNAQVELLLLASCRSESKLLMEGDLILKSHITKFTIQRLTLGV